MKTQGGIRALTGTDREGAGNLLRQLKEYGVFVVDRGELESWLPYLEIEGKGSGWLVAMFERLGSDPTSIDFVKPREGDVWDFLGEIREWASDPDRRGIPA